MYFNVTLRLIFQNWVTYSTAVLARIFWKNDTIEQLQMGVPSIATALAHTAL